MKKLNKIVGNMIIYLISLSVSGAILGFLLTIILNILTFWISEIFKVYIALTILILLVFIELGILKFKLPQNKWQIPSSWVNFSPKINMFIWGTILGAGVFTYIPNISFYLLYLYLGFFAQPYQGLIYGSLYGIFRGLPSLISYCLKWIKVYDFLDFTTINKLKLPFSIISIISAATLGVYIYFNKMSF